MIGAESRAAASTPHWKPIPTHDVALARNRAGTASAASVIPMPNSPPMPMPARKRSTASVP